MCQNPSAARLRNHSPMMGPNQRPMPAVPRFCTANSTNKISKVSGTTAEEKRGESTANPSTADSTEIAGVITPSP